MSTPPWRATVSSARFSNPAHQGVYLLRTAVLHKLDVPAEARDQHRRLDSFIFRRKLLRGRCGKRGRRRPARAAIDGPQSFQQLGGAGVTLVALLAQRAIDDLDEISGAFRAHRRQRLVRLIEDRVEQRRLMLFEERRLAGQHFIEDRTQRPQVGAAIDGLALHLLRRHVERRADPPAWSALSRAPKAPTQSP